MNAVVVIDPAARTAVVVSPARPQPVAVTQDRDRATVVTKGFRGPPGPQGVTGPTGPAGQSFQLSGAVANYAALPTLTADDAGQAWMTNNDGRVYVWSGSAWPDEGTAPVLQGPAGVDGKPGQIRFVGNGPPGTIIGASPNDNYLDQDTGLIYTLM